MAQLGKKNLAMAEEAETPLGKRSVRSRNPVLWLTAMAVATVMAGMAGIHLRAQSAVGLVFQPRKGTVGLDSAALLHAISLSRSDLIWQPYCRVSPPIV